MSTCIGVEAEVGLESVTGVEGQKERKHRKKKKNTSGELSHRFYPTHTGGNSRRDSDLIPVIDRRKSMATVETHRPTWHALCGFCLSASNAQLCPQEQSHESGKLCLSITERCSIHTSNIPTPIAPLQTPIHHRSPHNTEMSTCFCHLHGCMVKKGKSFGINPFQQFLIFSKPKTKQTNSAC